MGDILGLGITHYPSFLPRQTGPSSLRRLLKDPGLPERYRTPDGWPAPMRREWGEDEGAAFADQHRREVVAAIGKAREALDAFQPDFVVIWGDDQYENFREDIIPSFCVLAYDEVEFQPWATFGERANAWGEHSATTFRIKGHRDGAKVLASRLIESDFDLAYAYKPLHTSLGHAFTNSVLFLDWNRQGFDYPVVPFSVNCYGRRVIAAHGYMESLQEPIAEADVSVTFFMAAMPSMNMPAMRSEAILRPIGGGLYRGTGQVLMGGRWDVTVTVSRDGQRMGSRQFTVVAR